jgi:hypothetical protein
MYCSTFDSAHACLDSQERHKLLTARVMHDTSRYRSTRSNTCGSNTCGSRYTRPYLYKEHWAIDPDSGMHSHASSKNHHRATNVESNSCTSVTCEESLPSLMQCCAVEAATANADSSTNCAPRPSTHKTPRSQSFVCLILRTQTRMRC